MLQTKRIQQALAGIILGAALISAAAGTPPTVPRQPMYAPGSVFIYSDGKVEKLIEKGDGWYLVEDMRKRRYRRDLNFTLPPLAYDSPTSSYRQRLNSGNPDAIFPLDQSQPTGFSLKKEKRGKRQTIHTWSCNKAEPTRLNIMGEQAPVYRIRCTRYKWKKVYEVKEEHDLYFDPESAWVVKRVIRKNGAERTSTLVSVLPPEKATAKAIIRQLKKLKRKQAAITGA